MAFFITIHRANCVAIWNHTVRKQSGRIFYRCGVLLKYTRQVTVLADAAENVLNQYRTS